MKKDTMLKLKSFTLTACVFALAAEVNAQTNISTNLPTVVILATDPVALEGTSTASFTLIRHGDTNAALAVSVAFSGSGSNGVDYTMVTSPIAIPAGFRAVDIPIHPIVVNTGNKTVIATVETNSAYAVGYKSHAKVEIIDDLFNVPPPTVTITSPTNGSKFLAPATFTLTATAADADFPITSVSFFADDHFFGKATNSPFSLTVSNVHAGHYDIFARAVDSAGQSAFAMPVSVTVTNTNGVVIWHH
jgi:hypothetical protein